MSMRLGQERESCGFMMESLEDRKLLAATLTDGLLYVRGTGGNDNIELSIGKSPTRYVVSVNGEKSSFRHLDVGSVRIFGGNGSDKITVRRDGIKDPVTANGGQGPDVLRGIKDGQTYVPPPKFSTTFSFGEPRLDGVLLYAKDFGAVGDGITNDAPAIQAAIDLAPNGATVVLEPGATYMLRKGLVLDRPVNIEGRGAKLLMNTNVSPENNTIWVQSRRSDISYEWYDQASAGQTVFPLANATDLNAGDVVYVQLGQDPWDEFSEHYAALARVVANDGVSVTIDTPIPYDIVEGSFGNRITRITSLTRDLWIRNLQFDHIDGTFTDANIWIEQSENVTVENITGRFVSLLLAADSTGIVLNNAVGDLVRTHPASGRVINTWQSEVTASNIYVRTMADAAVVFIESWTRGLNITNMEVRWEHFRQTDNAVFHLTGGSSGIYVDDVTVFNAYPIVMAGSGDQTAAFEFGKIRVTGPALSIPVTYDVTYGGVNYANLQTLNRDIVLQPNQTDVTVPLLKGLIKSIRAKFSSKSGVRWIFLENLKHQGLELVANVGIDWTELRPLQMMGSDYPFNDPTADNITLHIYTLAALPAGTTLSLMIEYLPT